MEGATLALAPGFYLGPAKAKFAAFLALAESELRLASAKETAGFEVRQTRNQFIKSVAKASVAESVTKLVSETKTALIGFEHQFKGQLVSAKKQAAANPSLAERLVAAEDYASQLGAVLSKAVHDAVIEIELTAASRSATIGFLQVGEQMRADMGAAGTVTEVNVVTKELTAKIINTEAYRLNVLDAIASQYDLGDSAQLKTLRASYDRESRQLLAKLKQTAYSRKAKQYRDSAEASGKAGKEAVEESKAAARAIAQSKQGVQLKMGDHATAIQESARQALEAEIKQSQSI